MLYSLFLIIYVCMHICIIFSVLASDFFIFKGCIFLLHEFIAIWGRCISYQWKDPCHHHQFRWIPDGILFCRNRNIKACINYIIKAFIESNILTPITNKLDSSPSSLSLVSVYFEGRCTTCYESYELELNWALFS